MQRVIRRPEVKKITGLSESSIDRLEKTGKFPERLILTSNSIGWYEDEINEWLATRPRGIAPAPQKANQARRKAYILQISTGGSLK